MTAALSTRWSDADGHLLGVKDFGGETRTPGVYRADSFVITGTLTLERRG